MQSPTAYQNVLIVDGYNVSANILADRFRRVGAKVHVVNSAAAAEMMVRNKKIDVAFVGFLMKHGNTGLDEMFDRHGVPHITCATPSAMDEFAEDLMRVDDFTT